MGLVYSFNIKEYFGNYHVKKFERNKNNDYSYKLELENNSKSCNCPFCNLETSSIHQRFQRVLIDTIFGSIIEVTFTSRKFKCRNCKKIFTEEIPFAVGKYKYSSRILGLVLSSYQYYLEGIAILVERRTQFFAVSPHINEHIHVNEFEDILRRLNEERLENKKTDCFLSPNSVYLGEIKRTYSKSRKLATIKEIPTNINMLSGSERANLLSVLNDIKKGLAIKIELPADCDVCVFV